MEVYNMQQVIRVSTFQELEDHYSYSSGSGSLFFKKKEGWYHDNGGFFKDGPYTVGQLAARNLVVRGGKVYRKPFMRIIFSNGRHINRYFDTYEETVNAAQGIKGITIKMIIDDNGKQL